jgi:hypothetical protein
MDILNIILLYAEDKSIEYDPSESLGIGQTLVAFFVSGFFLVGPILLWHEFDNYINRNNSLNEGQKTNAGCVFFVITYIISLLIWVFIAGPYLF